MISMLGPDEVRSRFYFDERFSRPMESPYPSDLFYRVCQAAKYSVVVNLPISRRVTIDLAEGDLSEDGLKKLIEAANQLLVLDNKE